VDLVGYGLTNCAEGSAAPAASTATAVIRQSPGTHALVQRHPEQRHRLIRRHAAAAQPLAPRRLLRLRRAEPRPGHRTTLNGACS